MFQWSNQRLTSCSRFHKAFDVRVSLWENKTKRFFETAHLGQSLINFLSKLKYTKLARTLEKLDASSKTMFCGARGAESGEFGEEQSRCVVRLRRIIVYVEIVAELGEWSDTNVGGWVVDGYGGGGCQGHDSWLTLKLGRVNGKSDACSGVAAPWIAWHAGGNFGYKGLLVLVGARVGITVWTVCLRLLWYREYKCRLFSFEFWCLVWFSLV